MARIYFNVPQKEISEMSEIELMQSLVNLLERRSEIDESIRNGLEKEVELLRKENDTLRRLYILKAGE